MPYINASSRELERLLEEALAAKWGKRVKCNNGDALRRKLYVVRQTRTEFKDLMLRISPRDKNEVWIIKKVRGDEDAANAAPETGDV